MTRRPAAIVTVAALALAAGGCGGSSSEIRGEMLSVYVSVPLRGERAAEGKAIVEGAKLALADAGGKVGDLKMHAVYLDDTQGGRWSLARAAANARRAVEDATAIGYVGDLDSGATRVSLPITNQGEMVQISPGSTAVDLTRIPPVGDARPERYQPSDRRTFARVVPDDEVQARAAAVWGKRLGAREVAALVDRTDVGDGLAGAFSQQAKRLGLGVAFTGAPTGLEGGPSLVRRLKPRIDAVYYSGSPGRETPGLLAIARAAPRVRILGSDALIDPAFLRAAAAFQHRLYVTSPFLDPSLLPPKGHRLVRSYQEEFGHRAPPAAAYGYESMALLLNAIRRAGDDGDDRHAVIDQVLATQDRHSALGTYSIDGNGDTTLDTVSGYRVGDGLPVFPVRLEAPR